MKNIDKWKPSRYVVVGGKLRPTRNRHELAIGSRLYVGLNANAYNDHFHLHCRGRLLDLGCGKVPFYQFYKDHVDDIVCVDWSDTRHGAIHVDQFCDLTKNLPFDDAQFDTVLLSDVLEHIPTPGNLINEIARVLRKHGKLILNVPFVYNIHEAPHDYFRYTEFALARMVKEAGLNTVVLQPYGNTATIVGDAIAKSVSSIPLIGTPVAISVQWLAGCGSRRRKVRQSRQSITRYPSMYFLVAEKT